ncbi:Hypothetical protein, putative, partial [Bodo saltans]
TPEWWARPRRSRRWSRITALPKVVPDHGDPEGGPASWRSRRWPDHGAREGGLLPMVVRITSLPTVGPDHGAPEGGPGSRRSQRWSRITAVPKVVLDHDGPEGGPGSRRSQTVLLKSVPTLTLPRCPSIPGDLLPVTVLVYPLLPSLSESRE